MSAVVIPFAPRRAPAANYDWLVTESMAKARALLDSATPPRPDVLDSILATLQRIEKRLGA